MASIFGSEVKRLRESLGLTQKELAERLGAKQPYVAALESGVRGPGAATLYAICEALGVSCEHFKPFLKGEQ